MAKPANKLVIGMVIDTSLDPNDGVQQYVVAIGEWLRRQGHEVHYLAGQTDTRQLENLHSLARNIKVSFNRNTTTIPLPTGRRKLQAFMNQHSFDVLHVQTPHHPYMSQRLLLAAPEHTAVIGTFHVLPYGFIARYGNKLLGFWLRTSLRRMDALLAVSPVAARFAEWSFKKPATVLPNVIDYGLYHRARPLPEYNDKVLTILFLGRLVRRKGCLLLLQAVRQLVSSAPNLPEFRVLICGKGQLSGKLQAYVKEHGLEDIVTFTGYVSEADKPRYYASADIAVFPSSGGESFGIVLLEAMAGGRAVVLAGDNAGYRSVMASRPELLFDPSSPAALAEKLSLYLKNAKTRQQLADWGAEYTKQFDINVVGHKLLEIYSQALRKRP